LWFLRSVRLALNFSQSIYQAFLMIENNLL
jgi:hypothetical protein